MAKAKKRDAAHRTPRRRRPTTPRPSATKLPDVPEPRDQKVATPTETLEMTKHLLGGMQSGGRALSPRELPRELRNPARREAFMAALNQAVYILEEEKSKRNNVFFAPRSRMASLLQTCLAENAKSYDLGRSGKVREVKFDTEDIGGWAWGWISTLFNSRHAWVKPPKEPSPMPHMARFAVLGDWGSGMYGAPVSKASIEKDNGFQFIVHLGDIYYSGKDSEVQERFLAFWPRCDAVSLALNGNHEMYAGGHGYFDMVLKAFGQSASTFWLQNDNWTLVGLDTAYEDFDLTDDQVPWLGRIISQAGSRKIVLFSHHQPFSLLEDNGDQIIRKLDPYLWNKNIFAWYWGHEHRCVIHDRFPGWGMYGRLIGHGGVPQERDEFFPGEVGTPIPAKPGLAWVRLNRRKMMYSAQVPGGVLLDGPNEYVAGEGDPTHFSPHGYLTLSFHGPALTEKVLTPDGVEIYSADLA